MKGIKIESKREAKYREIFEKVASKVNWKLPTRPVTVNTREEAARIMACIIYFVGGTEMEKNGQEYTVFSKGYYHYIGA